MYILVNGIVKEFPVYDSKSIKYIESNLDCWNNSDTMYFNSAENMYAMSDIDFQCLNSLKDDLITVSTLVSSLDDSATAKFYRKTYASFSTDLKERIFQQMAWLKSIYGG